MKKVVKYLSLVVILFAMFVLGLFVASSSIGDKPIEVVAGWQKMKEINGVVPKGAILVVSLETNFVVTGNSDTKEESAFVTEGVIIFCEKRLCFSEGPLWIYIPEDYGFITKLTDFSSQCDEKLSELTEKKEEVENFYFVGHP